MYRKNAPQSPYNSGDAFMSPMSRPRFPGSPRFQQQFVPHHTGAGPGPCWAQPHTRSGLIPASVRSPRHQGRSPRLNMSSDGYSPRHCSGGSSVGSCSSSPVHGQKYNSFDSPSGHSPGGYTYTPRAGRGRAEMSEGGYNHKGRSSFGKDLYPLRDADCNPGGSSDIRQYYNPSMLQDPWENMQPIPATNVQSIYTTT